MPLEWHRVAVNISAGCCLMRHWRTNRTGQFLALKDLSLQPFWHLCERTTLAFFNPTYDQPFINLKCKFVTFNSTSDLVSALNAVWNNVSLTTQPYETLLDMGREIKFGVTGGQSDLVTFRVVQRTNGLATAGGVGGSASYGVGNDVGFNTYLVPIENRLSGNALADVFPVQISRQ